MKMKPCLTALWIAIFAASSINAQDVYLSAYKKIPSGSTNQVDRISFSEDSKLLAVTDAKSSLAFIEVETSNVLKKELGLPLTPEEQRLENALTRGEHAN